MSAVDSVTVQDLLMVRLTVTQHLCLSVSIWIFSRAHSSVTFGALPQYKVNQLHQKPRVNPKVTSLIS